MRLHEDFILYQEGEKTLLVPTAAAEFHGVVQGNRTVSAILECLKEDVDEASIIETLCARYDGSDEAIRADVHDVLTRLKEIGAIVD